MVASCNPHTNIKACIIYASMISFACKTNKGRFVMIKSVFAGLMVLFLGLSTMAAFPAVTLAMVSGAVVLGVVK